MHKVHTISVCECAVFFLFTEHYSFPQSKNNKCVPTVGPEAVRSVFTFFCIRQWAKSQKKNILGFFSGVQQNGK